MSQRTKLARYRKDPVSFAESVLIDFRTGKPFVLFDPERQFLRNAFTIGPDDHLLYPEQIYSGPKKTGKTAFAAIHVITTLTLFGDAYSEAICAANDYDQSVSRVFGTIKRIVQSSPLLRVGAKITADTIKLANGAVIVAIPSNYASAAGSDHIIAVFDELWAYCSERSRRLFDELVPPPTRPNACRLTVTYAGFRGESVLLEELFERGIRQSQIAPNLYAGDGMLMFWTHEPVAPWQTPHWIAKMRRSLRPVQFARMIENRFVDAESTFIDMSLWDHCTDPRIGHMVADRSLPIWVGVDASMTHDSTALAAVTWSKEQQQVRLVDHRVFTPRSDTQIDFAVHVEQVLREWRNRFSVRSVLFDPYQMAASSQRLLHEGLPMKQYPQTVSNLTELGENLFQLIKGRNLLVYPDEEIRTAVSRAIAVEGTRGWKIAKDKQSHRIDIVIAIGMAVLACVKDQAKPGYDRTYAGFQDIDWQGLRTNLYLQSGGRFRLW